MDKKRLISGLAAAFTIYSADPSLGQDPTNMQEDLLIMARSKGDFVRYKNKNLVDVLIVFKHHRTLDDLVIIRNLGGEWDWYRGQDKTMRAGLPRDKVEEYSKRPNVKIMYPNFYGDGIEEIK